MSIAFYDISELEAEAAAAGLVEHLARGLEAGAR